MSIRREAQGEHISKFLPQDIPDYSHIELTPEEEAAALNYARMLKSSRMEEEEKKLKRQQRIAEAQLPWDTKALEQFVLQKATKLPFQFQIDNDNRDVFKLLCLYFSGNKEFETYGFKNPEGKIVQQYSLQKGICLHSVERGTGKSVLMSLFSQNRKNCFVNIPTTKIAAFYQAKGDEVIDRYSRPWLCEKDNRFFYQSPIGICFEDLGDEDVKKHFGNQANVMKRVLLRIYDDNPMDKEIFKFFHATTNLTGDELEECYDKRVRSRLREMWNFIVLPGKDRRR